MTPPAKAKAKATTVTPLERRAEANMSRRRQAADSSYNMRDQRRAELDERYRAGLIAAFTLVPGAAGDRAGWDVERLDGEHVRVATAEVPAFLAGLDAGALAAGPAFTGKAVLTPDHGVRIPFSEIHELLGVLPATLYKWASVGEIPAEMIAGVEQREGNLNYTGATVDLGELKHWGRSTGRLLPDGTPNVRISATQAARSARVRGVRVKDDATSAHTE